MKMNEKRFLALFGGGSTQTRLVYFLICRDKSESFILTELSEKSEVNYSSVKRLIDKLYGEGFVILTETIGHIKKYSMNWDDEFVIKFRDLVMTNE
jgi:DNA-binding MarR family transcriptional regulator